MMFNRLQLASRSFATASSIKNVTIIGSGLMGSGIAQVSAQANMNVTLVDQTQAILDKSIKGIESSVKRVAKKQYESDEKQQKNLIDKVLKNIALSTNVAEAVSKADLVIEAIVENVEVKQNLLDRVENAVKSGTILATNTSSLKLADIAANLKHKELFGGLHFFNPVPVMKLLEVVKFDQTSEDTFQRLMKFGKDIGKVTVVCKDTPGFIVNRLLVPYMLEAIRMFDRGDASKEDIDLAMKLGAGYPMGPFQLSDYVGLDTTQFIVKGWHEKYPNEPLFQPIATLDKLVAEGKLGVKSGEGFYKYSKK
uniref:3-hydroxyacyl-CoA dehydrogenase n=1 Tax=Meloidogyne incognita TaxID=6306 RepID=A0A914MD45_MELIC